MSLFMSLGQEKAVHEHVCVRTLNQRQITHAPLAPTDLGLSMTDILCTEELQEYTLTNPPTPPPPAQLSQASINKVCGSEINRPVKA